MGEQLAPNRKFVDYVNKFRILKHRQARIQKRVRDLHRGCERASFRMVSGRHYLRQKCALVLDMLDVRKCASSSLGKASD